jgi:hypothetical protein
MPEKKGQWRPRLRDLAAETSKIMQVLRSLDRPRIEKEPLESTLWHHNRSLPERKKVIYKEEGKGSLFTRNEETACAGLVIDHDCPYNRLSERHYGL